jgi:hypothetical protein
MELILLLYVTVVFLTYNIYVTWKYGLLQSISVSFYETEKNGLFALFIWSVALPLNLILPSPLMFWGSAFLSFVGVSPAFKEKTEGTVHRIGANGGIGFIALSMGYDHGLWWIPILIGIIGLLGYIFQPKNWFWWVEMISFITIISSLYYLILF